MTESVSLEEISQIVSQGISALVRLSSSDTVADIVVETMRDPANALDAKDEFNTDVALAQLAFADAIDYLVVARQEREANAG